MRFSRISTHIYTQLLANKFDTDPLSTRDLLLYDIINVGRDGVGGAMAKHHGCMYRVDVLKQGKDARGHTVLPEEDAKKYLGKGVGFSTLTVSLKSANTFDSLFRTFARVRAERFGST